MLRVMDSAARDKGIVRDLMRDVDRTLLRENLKLMPEQRLEKFAEFHAFHSRTSSRWRKSTA
jgi:hypothetical protein